MTVFLPEWNSHCTRVRSTVVVSCSDELAVDSCPLLCLQRWVANVASGLSTVGLYCITILWQHICKGSLFILRWQAFCCMRLLNAGVLAGNAERQWHADSGKPRTFILCEKKHEWAYSNASTSLKNPLLVGVWQMCMSVKQHLCRLLFMQYKIT